MDAKALARRFHAVVAEELYPHLDEIDERNKSYGEGVCATHDFCDANMLMADAFEQCFGREPDPADEEDAKVWSEAWGLAHRNGFAKEWKD